MAKQETAASQLVDHDKQGMMFAVGMKRAEPGVHGFMLPLPKITSPSQVLIRVQAVGLDGTDFSMVSHDKKDIADGREEIVIGHEMMGVVEEVGSGVISLRPGDPVTMTVRRGCGLCWPCKQGKSDYCLTGQYKERGLHKLDGFLTKYTVEEEAHVVKLSPGTEKYGILVEPLSIAEKALEQVRRVQSRIPPACGHASHKWTRDHWGECKTALVIGAGTLGCLTAALLRMNGVTTFATSRTPEDSFKVRMLRKLGCDYMRVDEIGAGIEKVVEQCQRDRHLDIIIEAAGASELALSIIPYMSRSSVYVLTGIPRGEQLATMDTNKLLRHIVRYNQAIVGSVNSNRTHFEMAIDDIQGINNKFNNILDEFITNRFKLSEYKQAFSFESKDSIKIAIGID
ncbi:Glucose 1-dehydrogenase [Candidatus Burarchaeum australiense]|nr:Glucose 1-dehydrogenase [Candidatus Burarchaeum australiense]